ncbi:protein translocase subunit SecF [bacterium]|nr:protein translocase subunit SecF [bacterium]
MFIIKYRNLFLSISGLIMLAALSAIIIFGLNFGIDFTGGSIMEVSYEGERPSVSELSESLENHGWSGVLAQPSGEKGYIVRTETLDEKGRESLKTALSFDGARVINEERFSDVGPAVGEELRAKAWVAIAVVVVAIIIFIAYAFRHVSEPVSSWKYGLAAIAALIHDILVPTGVFAILGSIYPGISVDSLFVTALLAILGFSVHDTIVVFDRIRENLKRNKDERLKRGFEDTVGASLAETYTRSINTSLTVFLALLALYFVGSASTQYFALALSIGIIAGTYSSIFFASPLLVFMFSMQEKKKGKN